MKCHKVFIIFDLNRLVTLPMKTNLIAILMAVMSVVLAPTPSHAQTELREWVGNWQIRIDPSQDGGCFAAVAFDDGDGLISMRIGFDLRSQNEVLYVALMHQGWSPVPNSDYRFQMIIDDTVFEGLAQSSIGGGKLPTLRYNLHDPKEAAAFERVLAHGTNLYFRLNGTALPLVTLKDAAAVMKSLLSCEDTVLADRGGSMENGGPQQAKSDGQQTAVSVPQERGQQQEPDEPRPSTIQSIITSSRLTAQTVSC